ncbi:MAG: radical SAM family heme chaperone HemW [Mucinivorans sp.]
MAGIYIHIPFCRQICNYCDFYHSASLSNKEAMVERIMSELTERHSEIDIPRTLYFGGGTPSVLSTTEVVNFVKLVRHLWGVVDFEEVTLEANPDDLTPEYIWGLKEAGVNRLSIGIQSFNDDHLALMNRRHSAEQASKAVSNAQKIGFKNITIDLIYGLPFMTVDQWQQNLDKAIGLGVQHISAYHLTIEEKTIFGKRALKPVAEEVSELHFNMLRKSLCSHGFDHYEISNFALPGHRSCHNSAYWDGTSYLGVGPSAHSYDGKKRQWNVASNRLYLAGAPRDSEILSPRDKYNERIMTSLRTTKGLDINGDADIMNRAQLFLSSGDLFLEQGFLKIPPERFLISDYIISELFEQ